MSDITEKSDITEPAAKPKAKGRTAVPVWRMVLRLPLDIADRIRAVAKEENYSINGTVTNVLQVYLDMRDRPKSTAPDAPAPEKRRKKKKKKKKQQAA